VREYNRQLGIFTGAAVVLLVAQPLQAAIIQITGVKIQEKENGIHLILETVGGQENPPQIFTVPRGNDLIADIPNSQLKLPQGESYLQENPIPGIAAIEVSQLGSNSIRVVVKGVNKPPTGQVLQQTGAGITLSFVPPSLNLGLTAEKPTETPPLVAQTESPMETETPGVEEIETPAITVPESNDVLIPNPDIRIDGQPAPNGMPFQPSPEAPPLLPRAVAPPVGDIAVGSIDSSPVTIDLGTDEVIPRLVLREAPVKEVLSLLARAAGLNLIFTDPVVEGEQTSSPNIASKINNTISLDLENESIQEVFNSVLLASGLQASKKGNIIYVGARLPDGARNMVTRTFRLNQADAQNVASTLASYGGEVNILLEGYTRIVTDEETGETTEEQIPPKYEPLTVEQDENSTAPLLLRGLLAAADPRLNTVTLVGEARLVEMATSMLTQLDARRRQVAVNVKVIDVNLNNDFKFGSSFSFGINDTAVTNEFGIGIINFGTKDQNVFPNINNSGQITPFSTGQSNQDVGRSLAQNPNASPFGVAQAFIAQLQATIQNGNAKILTDPTLVVQEGQIAEVNLFQEVITNVIVERDFGQNTTTTTTTVEKGQAGLVLNIKVERIDDNGFVSLQVNPQINSIAGTEQVNAEGSSNTITLLATRAITSGTIRLRDAQTLILSGIILETERVSVQKVPLLGDIPLLGALFRSTSREDQRAEVIVMLTPQILDDITTSRYGYDYTPSPEASEILQPRQQNVPVEETPQ